MSRILVIGSSGNIGKPLVTYLREQGHDVLESDHRAGWREGYVMADIRNPVDLLPAFDWAPDVVYMLAALVSRVTCEEAASLAVDTNLTGLQHTLELSKRVGARFVYFSTSEVYGPDVEIMSEDAEVQPNNRYGLTKLLGEKLVEYEVRESGLQAVTIRPFMMYDEMEDFGSHRSAMIRFATDLYLGQPIEVHNGSARGWLHVSDAVRALEAAQRVPDYSIINIGHPDIRPMTDVAELVRAELDADPALVTSRDLPRRMTLVKRPTLDRQRDLLGVEPTVTLEDGVQRVVAQVKQRIDAQPRPVG
jgi:nucleoside-diphosphate-sugar epimerase